MGYNTTIVVMNDSLSYIESDPDFGRRLVEGILKVSRGKPVDVSAHSSNGGIAVNAATVIETHHADGTAIVAVGGNYGTYLGMTFVGQPDTPDGKEQILRQLADELGFRLVKKRK